MFETYIRRKETFWKQTQKNIKYGALNDKVLLSTYAQFPRSQRVLLNSFSPVCSLFHARLFHFLSLFPSFFIQCISHFFFLFFFFTPFPPFCSFSLQSGIQATDEAREHYQKLSRSKIQYVVFKVEKIDGTEVISLESTGEKCKDDEIDAKWEEFTAKLPEAEGRFGVFDLRWQQDDGRKRDSVCFISWTPDGCKVRERMIYGSTQESFKGSLDGIKSTIVAHDMSDLTDGKADVMSK